MAMVMQMAIAELAKRFNREEGQGMVEYALIIVLVSIAAVAMLTTLGTTIGATFTNITGHL